MSESEKDILKFWKESKIFEQSIENRAKNKKFVFFEGPPTANGKPGVHHVEVRSFKDVILRYKTMRGFFVPRVAGWDTHGLPVEVEVEKELGLKSKKDILSYGVAAFNKKCRESVWKYKELWENLTEQMGFWINTKNAYITYESSYIEKLWGIIKEFHKKKLLYEDYKVLPWCSRCGTALSSQEVAQGYQTITDKSVFVKFHLLPNQRFGVYTTQDRAYILAWTTTPWTLPGNVALAVGEKIKYSAVRVDGVKELLILASDLVDKVLADRAIERVHENILGKDLAGLEYEPLFGIPALKPEKSYRTYAADFVTTTEGTGIVHTAVMYGEDDYKLGEKIGLPKHHTVDEEGKFTKDLEKYGLAGMFVKSNGVEAKIIDYLTTKNFLFSIQDYSHEYPFCWRCKTPLLYYARKAWWVDVNKVRKNLLKNNEQINWHPDYLKHGRFGDWLKEEKNWAFSRERFWGTPLPVWRCQNCSKIEVVGSIEELQKKSVPKNNFIFMRHGEANHNVLGLSGPSLFDSKEFTSHLTENGVEEVKQTAKSLKKVDVIIHSNLSRSSETAKIVAETFRDALVEAKEGIRDINSTSETEADVKKRMLSVIRDINNRFVNKNILIIGHGDPLWILNGAAKGSYPKTGNLYEIKLNFLPVDEDGNLDLHKPYVDDVFIKCACGGFMKRTPEVVDVWFDSGAMPFAFEVFDYPADYIVEAVDQTRGWFYSLLAVATLLGKKAPYKNVISMGHLLDQKGKKMSKSSGNIIDPTELMEKYGADATRWYFYTINQPWDSKLFKDEDIKDTQRRFFVILENVVKFLQMYEVGNEKLEVDPPAGGEKLVINKWVLTRLNQIINDVTAKLDSYDIVGAARDTEYFVTEDLSRWYVRRVRDVMKNDSEEKKETESVLKHVLLEVSKLLAPFAPFVSEKIYKELGGEKESVHLEDWMGTRKKIDEKLLENMKEVRKNVSLILEARAAAGIKVRQPLSGTMVIGNKFENEELTNLIKEETNVKTVDFGQEFKLNTELTPELKEEGILRDLIREIQSARKEARLTPQDKVVAEISASTEIKSVAEKFAEEIKKETNLKDIRFKESEKSDISFDV